VARDLILLGRDAAMTQVLKLVTMSDKQLEILHRLLEAAMLRHSTLKKAQIKVISDADGVKVRGDRTGASIVLEEYVWNSKNDMLVRVLYRVVNAVFGEDAVVATCNSQALAEQCIGSLFKTDMPNAYELYVMKVFTNKLSPFAIPED
jgi:hypothetical protein